MNKKRSLDEIIDICKKYDEIRQSAMSLGYTYGSIQDLINICEKLKALGCNWGDKLIIQNDFRIVKEYYLTNSTTKFIPQKNTYYVEWDNGNVGRLQFVTSEYWQDVAEEWSDFIRILMSYNPVDYDNLNCHMIFDIENGKQLMNDYKDICYEIQNKMHDKIKSRKIEMKRKQIEKIQLEIDYLTGERTNEQICRCR